jgi:hypothetical protein
LALATSLPAEIRAKQSERKQREMLSPENNTSKEEYFNLSTNRNNKAQHQMSQKISLPQIYDARQTYAANGFPSIVKRKKNKSGLNLNMLVDGSKHKKSDML